MACRESAAEEPASTGTRRRARLALALALVATTTTSCATSRPVATEPPRADPAPAETATTRRIVAETRRAEEAHERAGVERAPRVEMAPAAADARLLAELARGSGSLAHPGRKIIEVEVIRFAPGQSELDAGSRSQLEQLVARLAAGGAGYFVEIQGHADAAGSEAENLRVGLARAEAVRRHLHASAGVPMQRLAVVSLGSSQPAGDNATAEGRATNRRAVVLVSR